MGFFIWVYRGLNLSTYLPVSEYFLAFAFFSPRITDLPTCLRDAPVCACLCDARRQVDCSDLLG